MAEYTPFDYANPQYWGKKYTIGYGQTETNTTAAAIHTVWRGALKAAQSLVRFTTTPDETYKERLYQPDELFSAWDHPPGTILYYRNEILESKIAGWQLTPKDFEGQTPPPRPAAGEDILIEDEVLSFNSILTIGAVVRGPAGKRAIYDLPEACIPLYSPDKLGLVLSPAPVAFTVGQVSVMQEDGLSILMRTTDVRAFCPQ